MTYRRLAVCLLLAAGLLPLLSCGNGHSGETYILVSVNVKVPYWQSAGAGFAQAGQQLISLPTASPNSDRITTPASS